MEQIFIRDLQVYGYHGVYSQEKEQGQHFLVQARADLSFARAAASDELGETVDYGSLCLLIRDFFREKRYDLLETAVNELALEILRTFPAIDGLFLEIGKPQAPIPMEFANVGVRLERRWRPVAISLGSNMGEKSEHLDFAVRCLENADTVRELTVSEYYVTEPYGYEDQEDFLNAAAVFETCLTPEELLDFLHEIEAGRNRERVIRWGPRTLDLDILFYDNLTCNSRTLTIPHVDMHNRLFVLQPLVEIAPWWVHPWKGKNVSELYKELKG